ncbi:MAG: hypothetical protein ABI345_13825 [Jatrophihabitans sp.]
MDDYIIKTGDMIQVTVPPPCVVPMLIPPIPLVGTSTSLMVATMAACLEGDETPPSLKAPMPYLSPPFVTPGMVQATVQILPTNKTMQTKNGKAILLKGTTFTVKLQVQAPAMQPTPAGPVPDPMPQYLATAQFITTNMMTKAG